VLSPVPAATAGFLCPEEITAFDRGEISSMKSAASLLSLQSPNVHSRASLRVFLDLTKNLVRDRRDVPFAEQDIVD